MGALSHIKVLDFTHHVAGPFCTKLLAGMGAELIKVERPGAGDPARAAGPFPGDTPHPEKSGMFLYLNTGKRSITLNLKDPAAKRLLRPLIAEADLVVENFRPGVMERLGLGYEYLRRVNRRIGLVSISNFGQTGPYRDYKGSDLIAYAAGGYAYTTGVNDREPLKHGGTMALMMAGLTALGAAMTIITGRAVTGPGQHADVSIQEVVVCQQGSRAVIYSYDGSILRREPAGAAGFGGMARCKDGYAHYGTAADADSLASFTGIEAFRSLDLAEGRPDRAARVDSMLLPWIAEQDKQRLLHGAQTYRLAWAIVQDARDILQCPQLAERGFWADVPHPVAGTRRLPGAVMDMTRTPIHAGARAPLLGEHNEEIYRGRLGLTERRYAALQARGAI